MLEYTHGGQWRNYSSYRGFYHIHTWPSQKQPNKLISGSKTYDCREYFIKSYRAKIQEGGGFIRSALKAYALVTLGHPKPSLFNDWQKSLTRIGEVGVCIINSFEKEHGWPLTKVYPVKCINRDIPFIFYAGPRKWTTSPYLMSIWTLCLRIGRNSWIPRRILKLDHSNLVRQLAVASKSHSGVNNDAYQMSETIREWDPFITLYKDLFGGKPRKYHWQSSHLNGKNDRPEGILKLVRGETGYMELYRKYFKLKGAKELE